MSMPNDMAMRRVPTLLGVLLLLAVGLTACATSEEARCQRSGGVWKGTFCEQQGN
jgi:hypothetical protein